MDSVLIRSRKNISFNSTEYGTEHMNLDEIKKYGPVSERMYYILLVAIVSYDCLVSTPIVGTLVNILGNAMDDYMPSNAVLLIFELIVNIRLIIIIPALYTILVCMRNNREKILSFLAIAIGWLSSYHLRAWNDHCIHTITLLVIASYGKDFRKITKYCILSISTVVMLAVILCLAGMLPDYVLERNGRIRHSFGMLGPTSIAGHMCAVMLAMIFFRNGSLKWYDHLFIIVFFASNLLWIDGRAVLLTGLTAYAGNLIYLVIKRKRIIVPETICTVVGRLLGYSYIVMFFVFFLLAATFNDKAWEIYKKTSFTESVGGRIAIAGRFLNELEPSLLGNYMQKYDYADQSFEQIGDYLFIDSSFARVYFIYGIIGGVYCVVLFTCIQMRLLKKRQFFRMFIIAASGLVFLMQRGILEPSYNILPLALFANLGNDGFYETFYEPEVTDVRHSG